MCSSGIGASARAKSMVKISTGTSPSLYWRCGGKEIRGSRLIRRSPIAGDPQIRTQRILIRFDHWAVYSRRSQHRSGSNPFISGASFLNLKSRLVADVGND